MAEALLLSQCGDASLWEKTQRAFFERQKRVHRLPFLDMLQAVIRNELRAFVLQSELGRWRETLALLSTYGKSDEFPALCELLAGRLERDAGDVASAKICYMCSMNLSKTIALWVGDLRADSAAARGVDRSALWRLVTKVVVFTQSNAGLDLGPECADLFSQYAHVLASHGRLDTAPRYIRGENQSEAVLRDRVFHASARPAPGRPPAFPFARVAVLPGLQQPGAGDEAPLRSPSQDRAGMGRSGSGGDLRPSALSRGVSSEREAVAGVVLRREASVVQPQAQSYTQPQVQQRPVLETPLPLPPGWVQLVDPASGRHYFANQATGATQWEPPTPSPVRAPALVVPQQPQPQGPVTPSKDPSARSPAVGSPGVVNVSFMQTSAAVASSAASSQTRILPGAGATAVQQPATAVAAPASPTQCEAVLALHLLISQLEGTVNCSTCKLRSSSLCMFVCTSRVERGGQEAARHGDGGVQPAR